MASAFEGPPEEEKRIGRVAALLGGRRILRRPVRTAIDAHDAIEAGLPGMAISHLVYALHTINWDVALEKGLGISTRTFQRRKERPAEPLSAEQSGRAWTFADILARGTELLGSQRDAEHWLEQPALGLDRRRPIDLLSTPAGRALLEDYLTRLEYGVYT